MCIEAFAMKDTEYQSLHCTLDLGIWRVPFDGPQSSPDDVIDGSWQIQGLQRRTLWGKQHLGAMASSC